MTLYLFGFNPFGVDVPLTETETRLAQAETENCPRLKS